MSVHGRVWLAHRAGTVPPSLQAFMESAVDAIPGDDDAGAARELAAAALACLHQALRLGDDRAAALPLLAADALMTAACEEAALRGDIADLTDEFSTARLRSLLSAASLQDTK
jgi:hypothetical protein